jgi:hypothetical protein
MERRQVSLDPSNEEAPCGTFVPVTRDGSGPRPTVIPLPRGTGLFSGWGVKL